MAKAKPSFLEKKFPTIIGLTILLGALAAGIFFIGSGPGIFAPRATPETTPTNVKITNVTDSTFTASFLTTEVTAGFLKYGSSDNNLNSQASDDRDQLTGNIGTYNTHHITVRGLQPETTYYFTIGTGTNSTFDNNGQPYSIQTGPKVNNPLAQTIYGSVMTNASTPAEGSMVYVTIENGNELSTLVRSSGTWAIPLAQLRTADGQEKLETTSNTPMTVFVQGKRPEETAQLATVIGQPQLPVETITIGTTAEVATDGTAGTNDEPTFQASESANTQSPTPTPTATPEESTTTNPTASPSSSPTATPTPTATTTPAASATPSPTPASKTVTLPATDSAQPESGHMENTLFLLVLGLSLTAFGGILYVTIKPSEKPID